MVEQVTDSGTVLAIVLRHDLRIPGISFFTPPGFPQQLGLLCHPAGHVVAPHTHLPAARDARSAQEVLLVRAGRVLVDIYNDERRHVAAVELGAGDVILLAAGGHGLTTLTPSEIVEIKQGPFDAASDKVRFDPGPGSATDHRAPSSSHAAV
jgi:hypothetical protein